MQLLSFRIRKYRHIDDSGDVEINDALTCIVGKNQSGKTALLKALYKFNPFSPSPYDLRREWPRGKRNERDEKQVVCEVKFKLANDEVEELAKLVDQGTLTKTVVITKNYAGEFEFNFPYSPNLFPESVHPSDIDAECASLPNVNAEAGPEFIEKAAQLLEEARRLAKEGRFEELGRLGASHKPLLTAKFTNSQPQHGHQTNFVNEYAAGLASISRKLGTALTMHQRALEYLVKKIPTFVYMDEYKSFSGRQNLATLKQKLKSKNEQLSEGEETFQMILKLSGLNLDQLVEQGASDDEAVKHDRQIDLDDAARTLTKSVAGRWGQQKYRVEFRCDGQLFFTDIEETDKDIGMIPLEEQSKGFQWFFSFDLHLMHDSQGTFEGCILLLDEPGLHLHPGGQSDLLARLDAYSEKNLTIYSTHLPFLIDLREPSRIKIIKQVDNAAAVSNDFALTSEADNKNSERLTLQAALGMKANQSYLVSQKNLVVEGVHDSWIITELSNVLERSNEPGLDDDIQISAAHSASAAVPLATFMIGQDLQVVALFDSDEEGRTHEEILRTKWLTHYKDVTSGTLLLGFAVNSTADPFEIEDLFPDDYYTRMLRQSHAQKLSGASKTENDLTLVGNGSKKARAMAGCAAAGIELNRGSAAKLIRKDLNATKAVADLPTGVAEKARALFAAIHEVFS